MTYTPEIVPATARYYERETLEGAVQTAKEMIEEWDYAADPHGYCHTRPMLVRLVQAIEQPSTEDQSEADRIAAAIRKATENPGQTFEAGE